MDETSAVIRIREARRHVEDFDGRLRDLERAVSELFVRVDELRCNANRWFTVISGLIVAGFAALLIRR